MGLTAAISPPRLRTTGGVLLCVFLVALGLLTAAPMATAGPDDTDKQLAQLRERLKRLEKDLDTSRGERDALRDELRESERQIGATLQSLKQLNGKLRSSNNRLADLRHDKERQRNQISTQIGELEKEARAAYILGQQEYVKMLLSQENPASISRVLTYHQYLQRARAARIQGARASLGKLVTLEDAIRSSSRELEDLRTDELRRNRELTDTRDRRGKILAQLNQRVRNQSQELERVRLDEQRLARLLRDLQTTLTDSPAPRGRPVGRFQQQKGRLSLPVNGRITARYGSPRNMGDMKWRGIFLAAPGGREVASVFPGRVVYAGWLRGFGLLLIVEHGDGYMTLYGHNQSLYKEAGDWVEAGQAIASVGNTGGPPETGLYFEIRHNGEPSDPLQWCRIR